MKIVGISTYTAERKNMVNSAYVESFTRKGITPILLPTLKFGNNEFMNQAEMAILRDRAEALIARIDVLVLSGGGDINPLSFGEENYGAYGCNIFRDKMEIALLEAAIKAKKPVMGICRGLQIIGQFFEVPYWQQSLSKAGELHAAGEQSITNRSEPAHSVLLDGSLKKYCLEHGVAVEKDDAVSITVNSWHHQGFTFKDDLKDTNEFQYKQFKKELRGQKKISLLAATPAVIEAFRHTELPIFATQWHPEEYGKEGLIIQYFLDTFVTKKEENKDEISQQIIPEQAAKI